MELQILGQTLPIRTNEDTVLASEVLKIAQSRIESAEAKIVASRLATTPSHVLTLALLEIAEEYVKARQRFEEFKLNTESKLDLLMKQVESISPKKNK